MVFASPAFVSLFLPLAFLLSLALRQRVGLQNACLAVLSLLFYAWGEPLFLIPLMVMVLCNGALAQAVAAGGAKTKTLLTALAVLVNLGILFGFKYLGMFVSTVNAVFSLSLPIPAAQLPLGISFFSFQALSYVLDVRLGKSEPLRNYGMLLLYLCFFPQLIAGPILRWHTVADQYRSRRVTMEGAASGLRRFILGLSKKVLLADLLGKVADAAFACPKDAITAPLAWFGAIAYTLQLYLDFSAYSDMAIGMGCMFGFTFAENFRHPLGAGSLSSFWRRWHITLTDWFRDYLYFPLGGNRRGPSRTAFNIALVFLFTGLWHGANWTFALWGAWNGLFVILEHAGILRAGKWPAAARHGYTLLVVLLGFVLFRAQSAPEALAYVRSMFTRVSMTPHGLSFFLEQCTPMNLTAFAASIAVSLNAFSRARERLAQKPWANAAAYALCSLLFLASYAAMIASGYHPFIYFRF